VLLIVLRKKIVQSDPDFGAGDISLTTFSPDSEPDGKKNCVTVFSPKIYRRTPFRKTDEISYTRRALSTGGFFKEENFEKVSSTCVKYNLRRTHKHADLHFLEKKLHLLEIGFFLLGAADGTKACAKVKSGCRPKVCLKNKSSRLSTKSWSKSCQLVISLHHRWVDSQLFSQTKMLFQKPCR
jgi:hypothetical protein